MRSVQQVDASEVRVVACPYCGRTPRRASGGFKVVRDKKLIGLIGYAPARDELGHAPSGSAVITVLWVNPNDVGEHVGTQLVQRVAWQLRASGVKCLIASGTRGVPTCERLPADWLGEVTAPPVAAALPRRLGPFPFWRGQQPFLNTIETTYVRASNHGLDLMASTPADAPPPPASPG